MDWLLYRELLDAPGRLVAVLGAASVTLREYGPAIGLPELERHLYNVPKLDQVDAYMAVGVGYIEALHQRVGHVSRLALVAQEQISASGWDLHHHALERLRMASRMSSRRTPQVAHEPDDWLDQIRVPECLGSPETAQERRMARRWEYLCAATAALQDLVDEIGEVEDALLEVCRLAMLASRELFAEQDGLCGWWGIRLRDAQVKPRDVFDGR